MPISAKGVAHALVAYSIWGGFGLYFHLLASVPAIEVLAHRIIWSALFVFGVLLLRGQLQSCIELLKAPSKLKRLLISSILISLNWGIYIWAVSQAQVVEASLGYYLTPLVSVMLGVLILKEKISPHQLAALVTATVGVGYRIYCEGGIPWIALALPFVFGLYGLARKQVDVEPLPGLLVETALVLPLALATFSWFELGNAEGGYFTTHPLLLIGAGVLTAVPLLAFASAARLLPLSILGFANYLTPSIQFVTAITLLNETVDTDTLISFILIWIALAIFSRDLYQNLKRERQLEKLS